MSWFEKKEKIGQANFYKKKTDWGAIFWTIIIAIIILAALGNA